MNISYLQKNQHKDVRFSSSEQFLLEYIEKNLDDIPEFSIVKLSELANVSTSTIVRTMKKIGYDAFYFF